MKYVTRQEYKKAQETIRLYKQQRDLLTLQKKVSQLAAILDTSLSELKSDSKKRRLSDRRAVIATHLLNTIPAATEEKLASILNRDRSSISNMKKRYGILQTNPDFKQIIIKINH